MDMMSFRGTALASGIQRCILAATFALCASGCRTVSHDPPAADTSAHDHAATKAQDVAAINEEDASDEDASRHAAEKLLESDGWYEDAPSPFARIDATRLRWHHQEIDDLVEREPEYRPDVSSCLEHDNPVIAANAAIVAARWGLENSTPHLLAAIRNASLRTPLRQAAVEALGTVRNPAPTAELRGLLEQIANSANHELVAGLATEQQSTLYAQLIRALARGAEPGDTKWFTTTLAHPNWQVRYAALVAWAEMSTPDLPEGALELTNDPDARVRAAALRAIGAHHHARASEFLDRALDDASIDVRIVAISELGAIDADEVRTTLVKLQTTGAERVRAASVLALGASGRHMETLPAVSDVAPQVRVALAHSLAQAGAAGGPAATYAVVAAENLVRDADIAVQQQVVDALADWPLDQAGPVLLLAIAEGRYAARMAAAQQLSKRWPAAAEFNADTIAESRASAVATFREKWAEEHASKLPAAETLVERMASQDLPDRRVVAAELAIRSALAELPSSALERLAERMETERDSLVWHCALTAILGDGREIAGQISQWALGHSAADVRRAGCLYLAAHSDPRHASPLVKALGDPDLSVVQLAVRALGAIGEPGDTQPLIGLLKSPNKAIRIEAAVGLVRLRAPQGTAALERLMADADPGVRLRLAQVMGEVGDRGLLEPLVTMLTNQTDVRRAVFGSLTQIVGTDVAASDDGEPISEDEEIRSWQVWYRELKDEVSIARAQPDAEP